MSQRRRYFPKLVTNRKEPLTISISIGCAFTGREWDKETGLYFYRARYYDPMEGRFIQKDPIGFAGEDVNLYAYVGNQPINYVDPYGLARFDPGGIAIQPIPIGGGGGGFSGPGAAGAAVGAATGTAIGVASFKDKGSNWATEQAKSEAKATGKSPCDILAKMLDDAKCSGDRGKIDAIIAAQKFMGCRNVQKRNSN